MGFAVLLCSRMLDVLVEGQEVSYTLGLMCGEVVEADVDLLLGRLLGHHGADEAL
jgi:hypothetical protein